MRLSFAAPFVLAWATACSSVPRGDGPSGVVAPSGARTKIEQAPPVPAFHWEPLDVSVDPSLSRAALPLVAGDVKLLGGAHRVLHALPEEAQDAVFARGFAIVETAKAPRSMGALYRRLDGEEAPLVFTLETLGEVVHFATSAALAEVEREVVAPALADLLARWSARFEAMTQGASTDMLRALRIARGIVTVARVLSEPKATVPADLEGVVREEVTRMREGGPARESVLLNVPIEYGLMGRDTGENPSGFELALRWLASAPLMFTGRDEALGPRVDVTLVRDHTRAAMLFAHAVHPRVDKAASATWEKLESVERFLIGPADDWSPAELYELAASAKIDLTDVRSIASVARVDTLRRAAASRLRARVHDGSGASSWVDMASASREVRENRFVSRFVPPTLRVVGTRVGLDAVVQQALVYPVVGPYRGNRTVETLDSGRRSLSRPLDFAAVLGNGEAREILRSDGDDAYESFDATLRKLVDRRPPEREGTRHASVYLSGLDLVSSLLTASAAETAAPASASTEYKRRALEVALATYTSLRYDFAAPGRKLPAVVADTRALAAGRAPLVLVEPHPEAIGRMVAMVRQISRGLVAYKALRPDGPAHALITSAERFLTVAFQAALLMANGLPPSDDQARSLSTMVAWLEALESAAGARFARAVDMHVDLSGKRVLAQGTSIPETLAIVLRDPKSGNHVLAFGGATRHLELVRPRGERLGDTAWVSRLDRGGVVAPAWSASYHFSKK